LQTESSRQYEGKLVHATVSAVADAIRWAERIMDEIDRRHRGKLKRSRADCV
jgi:hypothetical protein